MSIAGSPTIERMQMPLSAPAPTPIDEIEARLGRVRARMEHEGTDVLICYADAWRTANTRYFTDFRPVDGIAGIEQAVIVLPREEQPQMFVAEGCLDAARERTTFPVTSLGKLSEATTALARSRPRVAIAGGAQMVDSVRQTLTASLGQLRATDLLARVKAVKSGWEVTQLQAAASLTDIAIARLQEIITSGKRPSERDLARAADVAMIQAGADGTAFLSMVQAGPRSAFSLALPTNRHVQDGDLVLTDIGARYGNYVADGGRGFTVGTPTDEAMELVNTSVRAVEAGLAAARPGTTASALNGSIQQILLDAGMAEYSVEARGRGTGHGTGMDPEEELPWIGPTNGEILEAGMVFTLKATINKPGVGGLRTERVVHLTDNGAQALDQAPMRNHW